MRPKISAVMCTYRRMKCVERAINCFLAQDYEGEKELILFNTDISHPYSDDLKKRGIKVINCAIDYITEKPYTNVGAIRRDALTHATGLYYICWDDDDIFLPWMMRQGIDKMEATGLPSFKPEYSFFRNQQGLHLVKNTLEASVISSIDLIRKYGFLLETGKEGLGWYTKMRDNKELIENDNECIPHYCFNWGDGEAMNAGHKQSGDINNPFNFTNHKEASKDWVKGFIQVWNQDELNSMYKEYYDFINSHHYPEYLLEKYLPKTYSKTTT